ncbi:uncharacterized protein LOC101862999 [Aplysia californica]|uniref:Uncharacterized protein LOC101862999 n=1 Tax=Aplysia californica TaxID=6500 RepID=A0ABM0JE82_APLCA|nr:uncharacterized protein LOC101862999 [Aplysia californica]XP_005091686.1 uncharacterized protein LOC101862999 [Aplysia californica]
MEGMGDKEYVPTTSHQQAQPDIDQFSPRPPDTGGPDSQHIECLKKWNWRSLPPYGPAAFARGFDHSALPLVGGHRPPDMTSHMSTSGGSDMGGGGGSVGDIVVVGGGQGLGSGHFESPPPPLPPLPPPPPPGLLLHNNPYAHYGPSLNAHSSLVASGATSSLHELSSYASSLYNASADLYNDSSNNKQTAALSDMPGPSEESYTSFVAGQCLERKPVITETDQIEEKNNLVAEPNQFESKNTLVAQADELEERKISVAELNMSEGGVAGLSQSDASRRIEAGSPQVEEQEIVTAESSQRQRIDRNFTESTLSEEKESSDAESNQSEDEGQKEKDVDSDATEDEEEKAVDSDATEDEEEKAVDSDATEEEEQKGLDSDATEDEDENVDSDATEDEEPKVVKRRRKAAAPKKRKGTSSKKVGKCVVCGEKFLKEAALRSHLSEHLYYDMQKNVIMSRAVGVPVSGGSKQGQQGESDSGAVVFSSSLVNPYDFTFTCSLCSVKFMRKKQLFAHKHAEHESVKCDYEGKTLVLKSKPSVRTPRSYKSANCEICGAFFKRGERLKHHMILHMKENMYQCDICHLNLANPFALKKHKLLHVKDEFGRAPGPAEIFVCEVCGKSTKSKRQLKLHMTVHTGEKIFNCNVCHTEFSSLARLTKHKKENHSSNQFICDVCGSAYGRSQDLKTHYYRVHVKKKAEEAAALLMGTQAFTKSGKKIKRFTCETCSKVFKTKEMLNYHARVHTGEKPYICKVCNKSFRYPTSLASHKKIHSGEKPFECDVCHQRFRRKDYLQGHYRIHTGEKPYACKVCGQRFRQQGDMLAHQKRHAGQGKTFNANVNVPPPVQQHQETKNVASQLIKGLEQYGVTPLQSESPVYNEVFLEWTDKSGGTGAARYDHYEADMGSGAGAGIKMNQPVPAHASSMSEMQVNPMAGGIDLRSVRPPEGQQDTRFDLSLPRPDRPPGIPAYSPWGLPPIPPSFHTTAPSGYPTSHMYPPPPHPHHSLPHPHPHPHPPPHVEQRKDPPDVPVPMSHYRPMNQEQPATASPPSPEDIVEDIREEEPLAQLPPQPQPPPPPTFERLSNPLLYLRAPSSSISTQEQTSGGPSGPSHPGPHLSLSNEPSQPQPQSEPPLTNFPTSNSSSSEPMVATMNFSDELPPPPPHVETASGVQRSLFWEPLKVEEPENRSEAVPGAGDEDDGGRSSLSGNESVGAADDDDDDDDDDYIAEPEEEEIVPEREMVAVAPPMTRSSQKLVIKVPEKKKVGRKRKRRLAEEEKYSCYVCELKFQNSNKYLRHVKKHTSEWPFKCTMCNRGFVTEDALNKHAGTHLDQAPHQCVTCGAGFSELIQLTLHGWIHKMAGSVQKKGGPKEEKRRRVVVKEERKAVADRRKTKVKKQRTVVEKRRAVVDRRKMKVADKRKTLEKRRTAVLDKRKTVSERQRKRKATTPRKIVVEVKKEKRVKAKPESCPVCGETFIKEAALRGHLSEHVFYDIQKEEILIRRNHGAEQERDISDGALPFTSSSIINSYDFTFTCSLCNIKFTHKKELFAHRHAVHERVKCEYDSKALVLKPRPAVRTPRRYKPAVCEICGAVFKRGDRMKHHLILHTNKDMYQCDICHLNLANPFALKKHKLLHVKSEFGTAPSQDKNFVCEVCGKLMKSKRRLKLHMTVHTGEKIFNCNVCQMEFSSLARLTNHKKEHQSNKQFICDVCGSAYGRSQDLKTHYYRVHVKKKAEEAEALLLGAQGLAPPKRKKEAKTFPCETCSKIFRTKELLNYHASVHTGEKPYSCKICNKSFRYPTSLASHKKIHTGEKPFECDVCHQRFLRKDYLQGHYRIHTGEKPYACKVCGQRFRQQGDMQAHQKRHARQGNFIQL